MQLINYLKAQSSLRHRLLRKFVTELNAQYNDLQTHSNIRWLSKGKALKRLWDVKDEIRDFLISINTVAAHNHLQNITSIVFMTKVAFLIDLFGHINELNCRIQGVKLTVIGLWNEIKCFKLELHLFAHDINNDMLHFSTLKGYLTSDAVPTEFPEFINRFYEDFDTRFKQFEEISCILNLLKDQANISDWP